MTIQQVTATALQWGDKVTITDVAEMTIKHPLFQKAIELVGLQLSETLERNTFNALMGGTQVNYVNRRGSPRATSSPATCSTPPPSSAPTPPSKPSALRAGWATR